MFEMRPYAGAVEFSHQTSSTPSIPDFSAFFTTPLRDGVLPDVPRPIIEAKQRAERAAYGVRSWIQSKRANRQDARRRAAHARIDAQFARVAIENFDLAIVSPAMQMIETGARPGIATHIRTFEQALDQHLENHPKHQEQLSTTTHQNGTNAGEVVRSSTAWFVPTIDSDIPHQVAVVDVREPWTDDDGTKREIKPHTWTLPMVFTHPSGDPMRIDRWDAQTAQFYTSLGEALSHAQLLELLEAPKIPDTTPESWPETRTATIRSTVTRLFTSRRYQPKHLKKPKTKY